MYNTVLPKINQQPISVTIIMNFSMYYLPSNGGRCISPVNQPAAEQHRNSTKMANRFPPGRAVSPVTVNSAPYMKQDIKMRTVNLAR